MKRLTFDGVNDLYQHPLYGARTLVDIEQMDQLARTPKTSPAKSFGYVECSPELYARHERCVDQHGCGLF